MVGRVNAVAGGIVRRLGQAPRNEQADGGERAAGTDGILGHGAIVVVRHVGISARDIDGDGLGQAARGHRPAEVSVPPVPIANSETSLLF